MGPFRAREIIASARRSDRIKHVSACADTLCVVPCEFSDLARSQSGHIRSIARQLLPGVALPGLIYLIVSRHTPVLVALAAASSVPVLDMVWRLLQGKRPTWAGIVFIVAAGISVTLAMVLDSPLFILVKGAAMSAILGLAFAISALIRRPLTRTLALRLSSDHPEGRRRLAERWRHPKAHAVFCTLSVAWGALLLAMAGQQAALAVTVSPGMVMAVDGPAHAVLTVLGVVWSILYVRRIQLRHPDLGLLPVRAQTTA
jgi:hypothetical protein